MKSQRTKTCGQLAILFSVISALLLFGPFAFYAIKAFIVAETVKKLALGAMFFISGIIYVFCLAQKYHPRSIVWLLVLGIYVALEHIIPLIIAVAIASLLDEFVFTPLAKRYRELTRTNKEIDRRN